jgi:uncharacterized protein YeaO (DUF488 family)
MEDRIILGRKHVEIRLKRAHDAPARTDGTRILIDRVWPRGITKDELRLDAWIKDVAPSTELRKWFGHDPAKWSEFRKRYSRELDRQRDAIAPMIEKCRKGTVTLIFGAKDTHHNNAVALKAYLERHFGNGA